MTVPRSAQGRAPTLARDERARPELPTGTVTFLRTDVEGSMSIIRAVGSRWDAVNTEHLDLLRQAVRDAGGVAVRTEGDALLAAFSEAGAAVTAAIAAQRALADRRWPAGAGPRVRMALHTGAAYLAGDDYGGFEVNRAARIAALGHGEQIILTEPTCALVAGSLDTGVTVRDLGRYVVKDLPVPERLFQLDVPGLRRKFPPLRVASPATEQLAPRLTSFVGREATLRDVRALLRDARLVTLTGPGGIGKTSLAMELARAEADSYADGAWFVALDPVADPSSVPSAIARSIGLVDGPERTAADALPAYIADRSVLLVLDNFEHVLPAVPVVATILRVSPRSRVVVTSRSPLRVSGEQEYAVPALPTRWAHAGGGGEAAVGDGDDPGVRLFTDRARAVRPGWSPGADLDLVRDVCRLLDGLPLGIELAAARVSALPVRAIRDRLAAHLPLPGSGPRDLPERQQTLDATIGWSYDLLDPDLQHLLGDLAVFDGGFDVEQVHALHDPGATGGIDVLDGVVQLCDHSLVLAGSGAADESAAGPGVRFRLLRTVADYVLRRVVAEGREAELRRRHAVAYLALAQRAAPHLPGADQARWLRRLALDHDNITAAMEWAITAGEDTVALELGAAAWRYWQLDGHLHEGRRLLERALAMPGVQTMTRARLWAVAALGGLTYWQGDRPATRRWYAEQLRLARALEDPAAEVDALFNLAHGIMFESLDEAEDRELRDLGVPLDDPEAYVDLLVRRYGELGDERGQARAKTGLLGVGDPATLAPEFEALLVEFERLGDVAYQAMVCGALAWTSYRTGDLAGAARWMVRSVVESHALADRASVAISVQSAAILAMQTGEAADAAALMGAFDALCERYGVRPPAPIDQFLQLPDPVPYARAALGEDAFTAAYERGRRMSLDEAVRLLVEVGERAG